MTSSKNIEGLLVICPTPLGNLGDMTTRSIEALQTCDVVCAEDTRVTGKLLHAFDIQKPLERLDENKMEQRSRSIAERVIAGETIVYCSDAGMPGVSDPGLRLVRIAQEMKAPFEVLPGPTAGATAYVASGSSFPNFYFGGFLPRKDSQRAEELKKLEGLSAALIFYESPRRLVASLKVIAEVFPYRRVTVCRELTKLHEEVFTDDASKVYDEFKVRSEAEGIKGEIALVIEGPDKQEGQDNHEEAVQAANDRARNLLDEGMRKKEIAKTIAHEYGLARNEAYDLVLSLDK